MQKPADTTRPLLDAIAQRWSPRAFADRSVSEDDVLTVLEAARWAASASNEQPWRFVVARRDDPRAFAEALACLNDSNQRWAKDASALILAFAVTHSARTGRPLAYALHDLGAACTSMAIQATSMGMGMHPMAGVHKDAMRAHAAAPEGTEPCTVWALGYPGDPDALPDELAERERATRSRKPLAEIATVLRDA